MTLSDKQRKIFDYCKENGFITKATVNDMLAGQYYHNGKKYVGEILTRMLKQGLLIRKSRGVYKLGSLEPKIYTDKNQIKLF